jgi:uncharacterized coiled-coil protein SlyX
MMLEDLEHRLERVEGQHADYVRTLASHTAAMASNTATLAGLVEQVRTVTDEVKALKEITGEVVGELATLRAEMMAQFQKLATRPSEN